MRQSTGILGFCAWVLLTAGAPAASQFSRPNDHLGPANYEGKIHSWFSITQLKLPDGSGIPLSLLLSALPAKGMPLFGEFWWCPLLESTLLPIDDNLYVLSTLGGRHVYLRRNAAGVISSDDGKWRGKQTADSVLLAISGPQDWTYTFQKGRLVRAEKAGGRRLDWIYEGGRLQGIRDSVAGDLLRVHYGPGVLPIALTVNGTRYDMASQSVPQVAASPAGVPLVAGYKPSLSEIKTGKWWWKFPIVLQQDSTYQMDFEQPYNTHEIFTWQAATGQLISADEWSYSVERTKSGQPVVSRKDAKDRIESYFYDGATGVSTETRPDGTIVTRSYFTSGILQSKIRRLVQSRDGKEIASIRWNYDDRGRLVREVSGKYEKIWTWGDNGILASELEKRGDEILKRISYSKDGQILEWQNKKNLRRYSYEGGKRVIQMLNDGKPVGTLVEDKVKGTQLFFAAKEKIKPALSLSTGKVVSAEEIEVARQMAEKLYEKTK